MADNIELEVEVIEALRTGHKVRAIKKLRELKGIALKEAKELVDNYCLQNNIKRNTSSGIGVFSVIFTAVACYFAYQYFV